MRPSASLIPTILAVGLLGALGGCQTGTPQAGAGLPTPSVTAGPAQTPAEPAASPVPSGSAPEPQATGATGPGTTSGTTTITAPADGATVSGPVVTVTGEATAFEGTLRWRAVAEASDTPVAEGYTDAGANGEVGPFSFDVELDAGTWRVEVWEPGMGEGDSVGEPVGLVAVTVTVG